MGRCLPILTIIPSEFCRGGGGGWVQIVVQEVGLPFIYIILLSLPSIQLTQSYKWRRRGWRAGKGEFSVQGDKGFLSIVITSQPS